MKALCSHPLIWVSCIALGFTLLHLVLLPAGSFKQMLLHVFCFVYLWLVFSFLGVKQWSKTILHRMVGL